MKILWITEFYPASDRGEITGGVEARCFFVSKYLRKLGHDLTVIARPTSGTVWHPPALSSIPERLAFTLKALIEGLSSDFDIVEGTNSSTYPIAWILGTLKRKPVTYWYPDVFQGSWSKMFGPVGILGDVSDWLLLHMPCARYIAISQTTADKLHHKGIYKQNISVIYCGVDKEEINEVKRRNKMKKYDICAVSRLLGYKRLDDLIKAIKILQKKRFNLKVVIVGQGPEKKSLEALVSNDRLEKNIQLVGHVGSHKNLLEIIYSSKILCHPSIIEGFGIVIVEAAALGTPYVAADIPVISEITNKGQGGLLFKPKNVVDLAAKINLLLTKDQIYRLKSRDGLEFSRKYDWAKIAEDTSKVYQQVLDSRPGR